MLKVSRSVTDPIRICIGSETHIARVYNFHNRTFVWYFWISDPLEILKTRYSVDDVSWTIKGLCVDDFFEIPSMPTQDEITLLELEYGIDITPLLDIEQKVYDMGYEEVFFGLQP